MSSTSTECLIRKFYEVLFDPGQYSCFSLDAFGRDLCLVEGVDPSHHIYKDLQYFSINAMRDRRLDENVECFRNILVENDKASLQEQWDIVRQLKLPWSVATFSGNKSIHFIISLETPLESREMYNFVVEWIYSVLEPYGFDTKTKNPSRFSRVPGGTNVKRNEAGEVYHSKYQKPLFVKGRVPDDKLEAWLMSHEDKKPNLKKYDQAIALTETANPMFLNQWTQYLLEEGIFSGKRNDQFFQMAFNFIEAGFQCEEAIAYVVKNAKNLGDFPVREIESAFKSAYKTQDRRST